MNKPNWKLKSIEMDGRNDTVAELVDVNHIEDGIVRVSLCVYYEYEEPEYYAQPDGGVYYVVTGQKLDPGIEAKIIDEMLDYATECADYGYLDASRMGTMIDYAYDTVKDG